MRDRRLKSGAKALRDRWRADPPRFCAEVLGFEPWHLDGAHEGTGTQRAVLAALRPGARITWRSCHKVGKSRTAAAAALWAAVLYPGCRVVLTAPTYRQVAQVLWREVRALHAAARVPLGGEPSLLPSGGLTLGKSQIVGFTTTEPDAFSGISAPLVVYIADEASGVREEIFEAIDGNRAGGSILMLLGNPTQLSGRFYRSHHDMRDGFAAFHTEAGDVIRATAGAPIPGLATEQWVEEMAAQYGRESSVFAVRVLGQFPSQGSQAVIPLSMIEAAAAVSPEPSGRLEVGVDPARYGDDETAITFRRGLKVYPQVVLRGADTQEIAGRVLTECAERYIPGDREKPLVKVDEIGIGAGVVDALRRSSAVEVAPVNSANTARDTERHGTVRDELWFALREHMKDGGGIPRDASLIAELSSAEYSFDAKGRQRVEAKDRMKQKLGRSPDRADSLALAIYRPRVYAPRALYIPGI